MVFCQIVLEVLPDLPDDRVAKELLNESSIIVREDVSEYEDALFAEGVVELSAGWHVQLVLFLGLTDSFGRVQEENESPRFEVGRLLKFKVLYNE